LTPAWAVGPTLVGEIGRAIRLLGRIGVSLRLPGPGMARGGFMATATSDIYYDPYDFEIDADPYRVWKRLRDEAPLYYNEKYDFYALSRFDDVERGLSDWQTYSSAEGSVLEVIKANMEMPPGLFIF
jgi:cytochrome P450